MKLLKGIIIALIILIPNNYLSGQNNRPNILWINCDDLGQELACYGNPDVRTPHMDRIAQTGLRFSNAFANAPVCSSSRSSQITGMYPSAINCLNHRTVEMRELPGRVVPVMDLFRAAGYFCTNGQAPGLERKGKEDYNFSGGDWFDGTDWRQRAEGQPFFAQVQIHEPHRTFERDPERPVDPGGVTLPGCYPDHPLLRADWALYLESVQKADHLVGEILERLEREGLADNTIMFLFGDNGRPHLRDKQWLYEGGLKVPLLIRWPGSISGGEVSDDLVSLVDVSAMSLAAAGIEIPEHFHGKDVLGGDKREYVFGFRQRCGDAVDDIRSVRDPRFKLIWNRMPDRPYMQLSSYKKLQYPAFTLYRVLDSRGELETPFNQFMADSRPEFELYDLDSDPEELNNLAGKKGYRKIQKRLFSVLKTMLEEVEKEMIVESAEAIKRAKQGSEEYATKGFEKRGLAPDAPDEEILKYWEKELLSGSEAFDFPELQEVFKVSRTNQEMNIDGKASEAAWKNAESRTFEYFYRIENASDRQQTSFRMLWDEENLYVLFECEDQYITARETKRDAQPYFDDCAEIFLIPVPEALDMHLGFELNLYKASNDFVFLNDFHGAENAMVKSWDPDFKVGVTVDGSINDNSDIDRGWSMEMAIPLSLFKGMEKFSPVKSGNSWTFLAIRQDRNDPSGNRRSTSTIFPMTEPMTTVHDPDCFGQMLFVKIPE